MLGHTWYGVVNIVPSSWWLRLGSTKTSLHNCIYAGTIDVSPVCVRGRIWRTIPYKDSIKLLKSFYDDKYNVENTS